MLSIPNLPEAERPREKLLKHGPKALSDAELLAIFLRVGVRGKTAIDLAEELLESFSSLRNLLSADLEQFCQIKGMGPAKYIQLQATLELSRRYFIAEMQRGESFSSPDHTRRFLLAKLHTRPHEVFACLFLDTKHRVIAFDELFYGTIDSAAVYPREVLKRALAHNAAAVIFAHNHPSGDEQPSQADISLTQRLKTALDLVDIRVLDHFVIGDRALSFAEQGLL
ncbi:DNA repair protein RadC [Candidatus Venteria ishoeyi]|uniref:RadC family protein n=1 Tax=Candidatus Venteria ishoeyi TaxID=1899563 RepID=UPI0025A65ED6|nr:DNA repair protein RadC [Candidatus Venteria ishoeyi]MDM8545616.1 DNA repair protein RadC [Candidatus Venteria ishoeyi]